MDARDPNTEGLETYLVGGAVRDELLGDVVKDRDFVVIGSSEKEMERRGFQKVGKHFPVFLHPVTHEEYALARTERKTGRGHQAFSFNVGGEVSLEDDLKRRDLTINAIAKHPNGDLIDPFQGVRDLENRCLRHVSPAFAEDPLRVLRVARFSARFGFTIAPETLALMHEIAASGELATLSKERVWNETQRALDAKLPSRYFNSLSECDALSALFPSLDQARKNDFDRWSGNLTALDHTAPLSLELLTRIGIVCFGLDQSACDEFMQALAPPKEVKQGCLILAEHRAELEGCRHLSAQQLLALVLKTDGLRRLPRLQAITNTVDVLAAGSVSTDRSELAMPRSAYLARAVAALKQIDHSSLGESAQENVDPIKQVSALRLRAMEDFVATNRD